MDGWTDDGWMDGWMDGRTDGWMDAWQTERMIPRRFDSLTRWLGPGASHTVAIRGYPQNLVSSSGGRERGASRAPPGAGRAMGGGKAGGGGGVNYAFSFQRIPSSACNCRHITFATYYTRFSFRPGPPAPRPRHSLSTTTTMPRPSRRPASPPPRRSPAVSSVITVV